MLGRDGNDGTDRLHALTVVAVSHLHVLTMRKRSASLCYRYTEKQDWQSATHCCVQGCMPQQWHCASAYQ